MRVESYKRDWKDGYKIVGFNGGMIDFLPRHGGPLEMKVFHDGREVISDADWKRYVFPNIKSNMFNNPEFDNQVEFIHNWHDIIMEKYGDWKLDVVEVTPVSVILEYGIPSSHDCYGFLWFAIPETMHIEIKGPETSDGTVPAYSIEVCPNAKTAHIVEDMGHTVRDIHLCVKDSSCPINPIYVKQPYSDNPYVDNQHAEITEYVCM